MARHDRLRARLGGPRHRRASPPRARRIPSRSATPRRCDGLRLGRPDGASQTVTPVTPSVTVGDRPAAPSRGSAFSATATLAAPGERPRAQPRGVVSPSPAHSDGTYTTPADSPGARRARSPRRATAAPCAVLATLPRQHRLRQRHGDRRLHHRSRSRVRRRRSSQGGHYGAGPYPATAAGRRARAGAPGPSPRGPRPGHRSTTHGTYTSTSHG